MYLAIASALVDDIANGRLIPDDPLPTQRDLADQLGVAIGTITRAYAEAEKRGLINANGRKGTFVGPGTIQKSALDALIQPAVKGIDFGMIHPDYSLDPDLGLALRNLSQRADINNLLRYSPPEGVPRHKKSGAEWIKRLGMKVDPESIILTSGAQNGLFLILATMAEQRETVLVEELVYPGVKSVAETLYLTLHGVRMDAEGILPDALEASCKKTNARVLYCTPDIQNPTTGVLSDKRRRAIIRIAQKYDLLIIEDAIHRPLLPDPPKLIAELAPERTFLLASISKAIASGLRVGFITGPPSLRPKINETTKAVNLMVSPLPFELFSTWIEDGTAERIIEKRRREAQSRQELIISELPDVEIKVHPNSYYCWLTLPGALSCSQFAIKAYEQGVSVATADVFAVEERHAPEAVRICLATPPNRETVKAGLRIIGDILKNGKPKSRSVYV